MPRLINRFFIVFTEQELNKLLDRSDMTDK